MKTLAEPVPAKLKDGSDVSIIGYWPPRIFDNLTFATYMPAVFCCQFPNGGVCCKSNLVLVIDTKSGAREYSFSD